MGGIGQLEGAGNPGDDDGGVRDSALSQGLQGARQQALGNEGIEAGDGDANGQALAVEIFRQGPNRNFCRSYRVVRQAVKR